MRWIKRGWRGEERLWKIFWLYGLLLSFFLSLSTLVVRTLGTGATIVFLLFYFAYIIWSLVAQWRCAFNVQWKGWGYIVRSLIIVGLVGGGIEGLIESKTAAKKATSDKASVLTECRKELQEYQASGGKDLEVFAKNCIQSQIYKTATPVAPIHALPANQTDYSSQCQKIMADVARKANVDPQQYIANNQPYLKQCMQHYAQNFQKFLSINTAKHAETSDPTETRQASENGKPEVKETDEYILYVPGSIDKKYKYPLLVALSPSADAQTMFKLWEPIAEKHKWLLYASKTVRNGVPFQTLLDTLVPSVQTVAEHYPVDATKIIATGFSGGAMTAHYLAYQHPELITAVIANTGMIADEIVQNVSFLSPRYPHDKIAVFLASPTDFRFEQMKRDRQFLEHLGWKTQWLEFSGGHVLAPNETLEKAAEWVSQTLKPDVNRE